MMRWGAAGLFSVVLLPVVAAVALSAGSPGCGPTFVGAPGAAVVTGRVSTFGPPGEKAGATASGNLGGDAAPGISLHIPGTSFGDASNRALLGHLFHVQIGPYSADLPDIDLGPADYLNRQIDVTGAGAAAMGIDPRSFPTDSVGSATEIPGPAAGAPTPVSAPLGGCVQPVFAGGSGLDPIPGFTPGRDDDGVDGCATPGMPIFAPAASTLVEVLQGWYAGQPLLLFRFDSPDPSWPSAYWYVAEQITPVTEQPGARFAARQEVASYAPTGTCIETGWGSPTAGSRTLAAGAGAGAAAGALTSWGESFKRAMGIPWAGVSA